MKEEKKCNNRDNVLFAQQTIKCGLCVDPWHMLLLAL